MRLKMNAKTQRCKEWISPLRLCVFAFILFLQQSCDRSHGKQVILYTSIDDPVARPIIAEFEKSTGIKVTLVTDAEASKTVGLAERLRAEKSNPQCDVWWGNEPFHTINLADEGVLSVYESPVSADIPAAFKDTQHRWASVGLRVRTLVFYKGVATPADLTDFSGLVNPALKDRIAMARPTAGTTGGHVAVIYWQLGNEKADALFKSLRDNGIKLLGGNSVVVEEVSKGTIFAGITDNDDAANAQPGTIFARPDGDKPLGIPSTVALVTGAPHSTEAKQLIDFLLSRETEKQLMEAKFVILSVRDAQGKTLDVDYAAVAKKLPDAVKRAMKILEGRE